jgi:tetratricopeptide (TPR) repeat protein
MTASQIQAAKAANSEATAENALIAKVSQAQTANDWAGAEAGLKQLTTMNPTRWDFSQSLANAQFNQGKFADAAQSYATAIQGASQDKTDPAGAKQAIAAMYTNQGNAYLKLHNDAGATDAFAKAAALSGDSSGSPYLKVCATAYNSGKDKEALAACDKAITADPTQADAYFIKGSILVNEGETDAKGNFNVPPGTVEALQTYLKLAPTGKHVADAKAMLQLVTSP